MSPEMIAGDRTVMIIIWRAVIILIAGIAWLRIIWIIIRVGIICVRNVITISMLI